MRVIRDVLDLLLHLRETALRCLVVLLPESGDLDPQSPCQMRRHIISS